MDLSPLLWGYFLKRPVALGLVDFTLIPSLGLWGWESGSLKVGN